MCRLQSGFGRVPWLEDFSYVNDTAALQENDRANGGSGQTCNHEQFKQFSSFLSKLIAAAKEFSLPPERQKFGLITEKSLASPFTVGESDSWTAVLQLAGCPHCSKILKAEDDIQRLLKMENPIVSEVRFFLCPYVLVNFEYSGIFIPLVGENYLDQNECVTC